MDRVWWATVHRVTELDTTERLSTQHSSQQANGCGSVICHVQAQVMTMCPMMCHTILLYD